MFQEIDAVLAGGLTEQDEDDVLAELEALTQVEKPCICPPPSPLPSLLPPNLSYPTSLQSPSFSKGTHEYVCCIAIQV